MAKISDEREGFSHRLRQSLRNTHHSADSPTELARDFNVRFSGRPVTVHAARKWLVGEAIPTQDKMRALADWLHVPVDWLRFGGDERQGEPSGGAASSASTDDIKLIADLQLLGERDRQLVREFIRILLRANSTRP